jgi:hypothetical protein
MILKKLVKPDPRLQARLCILVELGRRRDRILESPILDLPALAALVADYIAADMPCAAAALSRRLDYYRSISRGSKIESPPCLRQYRRYR